VWGGTIGGTDTYTGAAATDTPVSWTGNEIYIGIVTNANTITTPTLNIGSRGAKTIVDIYGQALTVGAIAAGSIAHFFYDGILDKVIYSGGGVTPMFPIEIQVAMANELGVNLWTNFPTFADDTYVANTVAYVRDHLNASLTAYLEYSNEVWNNSFPQTNWAVLRAAALGLTHTYHSWYGLRVRMIHGLVTSNWAPRSTATLRRVLAFQAFGDNTIPNHRLITDDCAPSGTHTGTGNATYNTFTGSADYTQPGQRAVDFTDTLAYATYFSGGTLTNGSYSAGTSAFCVSNLQTLATAFNSNASDPTSLAFLDNDFRTGTTNSITISSVSGTTINATANGLSNGNQVLFFGTIPTGLSAGTLYYVVNAATNSFSVSATSGGSAISVSGSGGTVGKLYGQCLFSLDSVVYRYTNAASAINPGWETVAATYDSYRAGAGQSPLTIECYEGGLEALAPTSAQCTTMGVTVSGSAATASAALAAGLVAYKNDKIYAFQLARDQHRQFMGQYPSSANFGLMAHSVAPSWYYVCGGGQWALLSGPGDSTPYQTYYGVAAFNNNKRRFKVAT
jgi:hypothetical protein